MKKSLIISILSIVAIVLLWKGLSTPDIEIRSRFEELPGDRIRQEVHLNNPSKEGQKLVQLEITESTPRKGQPTVRYEEIKIPHGQEGVISVVYHRNLPVAVTIAKEVDLR